MSARKDGGPAFPVDQVSSMGVAMQSTGMTLRDHFAGQAMQSLVQVDGLSDHDSIRLHQIGPLALDAYRLADAMLKARAL